MAESLPCPSWVWSNNSNVHVAKDRSWFGADYTPLSSTVNGLPVVGIGTVELPVERSPSATGPRSHGILRLSNVLHVPQCFCNVIGYPDIHKYVVTLSRQENSKGTILDEQGRIVAYFDPQAELFQIKLSSPPIGPQVGPSPFNSSGLYYINAYWPDSEREKWEASRPAKRPRLAGEGPLSTEEKQWLKEHWGGEYKFLACYGLSIYKEEDREEGRTILRALMAGDD